MVPIALAFFGLLMLAQWLQIPHHGSWLWPLTVTLLGVLSLTALSALAHVDRGLYQSTPSPQPGSLLQASGLLAVGYVAFEALLAARQEVRDPRCLLPRALAGNLLAIVLLFALTVLVIAGLRPLSSLDAFDWISVWVTASSLPHWIVNLAAFTTLILGTVGCLRVAVGQLHSLSHRGALPHGLLVPWRHTMGPPLLFAVLSVTIAILIARASPQQLTEFAAGMCLVAMTLLDAAAIYSHRAQPDRRRWFTIPLAPLIPLLAVVANLALLRSLPQPAQTDGGLCLLLGLLLYVVYGRRHQAAASVAECIFGPQRSDRGQDKYRILVPIGQKEDHRLLLSLATALSCQFDGEVIPLQVVATPDPLANEKSRRIAGERNTLFKRSVGPETRVPMYPITRLAHSVPGGILDTAEEESCDLILMSWLETPPSRRRHLGSILDAVVREAPCDVVVVAFNPADVPEADWQSKFAPPSCSLPTEQPAEAKQARGVSRILVPAAGGPHAPLAMRLGLWLAREYVATVTVVHVVEPGTVEDESAEISDELRRRMTLMRQEGTLPEAIPIQIRVVTARSVAQAIAEEGKAHDLVLIGASEERLIDQVIFGSLPERVARACPVPVLMIKKYPGFSRLWLQRLWNALAGALPQLSRREQAEVYRTLRRGARPHVDFFVMMGLAAVIATFGLLQSSSAVIIGAMLVAPLFTPIISLSMAIVRTDARLLALAAESAIKGILLATGLGTALAALTPLLTVTPEIVARTHPNLFDLAVALASGAAGAYALARKDVAASLPGVGIAAALVPPLCTVGIGLAMGEASLAVGAGLLFSTNLVAITLAGAVMLLLLGFRPPQRKGATLSLRRGFLVTIVLLLIIATPLAAVFVDSARESHTRSAIDQSLRSALADVSGAELSEVQISARGAELQVTAVVYAPQPMSPALASQLSDELSHQLSRPVAVRLATIHYTEAESAPSSQ
jgi:uncharacterized hydrophobic protein (TIGR00271 family)